MSDATSITKLNKLAFQEWSQLKKIKIETKNVKTK